MQEQRGDPGFTFAGVLILAALGAFAWRSAPLETARQPSDVAALSDVSGEGKVAARLWQDPFRPLRHYKTGGGEHIPVSCDGFRHDMNDLSVAGDSTRLTVLSVMLSPGSYSELEERRRRRRYAVLAGLGDIGFVPRDAESLGVLSVSLAQQSCEGDVGTPVEPEKRSLNIPYEWYDYENPVTGDLLRKDPVTQASVREVVLVLWLDESRFTAEPFARFKELVSAIVPRDYPGAGESAGHKPLKVTWKVIGPARSGTLRHLVADQCAPDVEWLRNQSGLAEFDILSPVATVADSDLMKNRPVQGCGCDLNGGADTLMGGFFTAQCDDAGETCLRFIRTIQSDDVLIGELARELGRRGFRDDDDLVVISEWDTYFGRYLPRALNAALAGERDEAGESPVPRLNLLRYTYERGIDGITAGVNPKAPEDAAGSQDDALTLLSSNGNAAVRRPEGTAQFDYIRRLADTIQAHDRHLRLTKGRGVRAVAILGSDVYDKMLVLRALRYRLPGTVWLTTDLDTHFLHPSEFSWTRSLIVAATYGLSLPREIQPSSPPFRDSYQTSVYLATRMATDPAGLGEAAGWFPGPAAADRKPEGASRYPDQAELYEYLPPRLFEIGRHGEVPLGTENTAARRGGSKHVNALPGENYVSSAPIYLLGTGLVSILALFALHQLRPRSGRPVVFIIALLISAALLAYAAVRQMPAGEPLSIYNGISVWPTEFGRLLAVFLALAFLWTGYQRLQTNALVLANRYFCGNPVVRDRGLTLREAFIALYRNITCVKPRAWFAGILVLAALLMFVMYRIRMLELNQIQMLAVTGAASLAVIGIWALFINGKIIPGVRVRSINNWFSSPGDDEESAAELWTVYREYGALRHRMLRSVSYLLVYFVFAIIVFSLMGNASPPCRGYSACDIDRRLLGIGVLLMLFLLFFVVDATRLCICWIEKLQNPSLSWDDTCRDKLARKLNLPASHAASYLQMHLIGERTREVGRLIYYPVVIILLMLLVRSTYFDDWGFPRALAVVVGANFLIAVVTAARLNAAARQARENILGNLEKENLELQADSSDQPAVATPDELGELIKQLGKLRTGAFQRPWDQPIVRGSLLLLGGMGVTYAEYLPLLS